MIQKLLSVHPKFWLFALGTLVILFFCSFFSQKGILADQEQTLQELTARQRTLIEENAAIQHKIDFTYTEEYIRREARTHFDLIMPGEILFKLTTE